MLANGSMAPTAEKAEIPSPTVMTLVPLAVTSLVASAVPGTVALTWLAVTEIETKTNYN